MSATGVSAANSLPVPQEGTHIASWLPMPGPSSPIYPSEGEVTRLTIDELERSATVPRLRDRWQALDGEAVAKLRSVHSSETFNLVTLLTGWAGTGVGGVVGGVGLVTLAFGAGWGGPVLAVGAGIVALAWLVHLIGLLVTHVRKNQLEGIVAEQDQVETEIRRSVGSRPEALARSAQGVPPPVLAGLRQPSGGAMARTA